MIANNFNSRFKSYALANTVNEKAEINRRLTPMRTPVISHSSCHLKESLKGNDRTRYDLRFARSSTLVNGVYEFQCEVIRLVVEYVAVACLGSKHRTRLQSCRAIIRASEASSERRGKHERKK